MLKISRRTAGHHAARCARIASRCRYSSSAESSTILVQHHPAPQSGSIRVLLLDRPEARNALSKQLITDLRRNVDEIQAKGATGGIRALIIASNSDKAFCAGADLRERRNMSQEEFVEYTRMMDPNTYMSQCSEISRKYVQYVYGPFATSDSYDLLYLLPSPRRRSRASPLHYDACLLLECCRWPT